MDDKLIERKTGLMDDKLIENNDGMIGKNRQNKVWIDDILTKRWMEEKLIEVKRMVV